MPDYQRSVEYLEKTIKASALHSTWIRRESTDCRPEAARGVSLWVPCEGRQHGIG